LAAFFRSKPKIFPEGTEMAQPLHISIAPETQRQETQEH
jgi:hypothetical protein